MVRMVWGGFAPAMNVSKILYGSILVRMRLLSFPKYLKTSIPSHGDFTKNLSVNLNYSIRWALAQRMPAFLFSRTGFRKDCIGSDMK